MHRRISFQGRLLILLLVVFLNSFVASCKGELPNEGSHTKDSASTQSTKALHVLQESTCEPDSKEALANARFIEWFLNRKGRLLKAVRWPYEVPVTPKVSATRKGVRLVVEKDPLAAFSVICKIPRDLPLRVASEVRNKFLGFDENAARLDPNKSTTPSRFRLQDVMLAVQLLEEKLKGDTSEYAAYLEVLPTEEEIIQVESFTDAQLEEFQHSAVINGARSMEEKYPKLVQELVKNNIVRIEWVKLFRWAYLIVRNRAVPDVVVESKLEFSNEMVLIPFVDMFGIAANPSVGTKFDSTHMWLYITEDVESSREALVNIGSYANIYYLQNMGIVPESNLVEMYPLDLFGFPSEDPLGASKEKVWTLEAEGRGSPNPNVLLLSATHPSEDLRWFFRLLTLREEKDITPKVFAVPLEPAEETLALFGCLQLIEVSEANAKFPTTLAEDKKQLSATDVKWTDQKILALRYRIWRKEILHRNKCFFKQMIRELHQMKKSFEDLEEYYEAEQVLRRQVKERCFSAEWSPDDDGELDITSLLNVDDDENEEYHEEVANSERS